MGNYKFRVKNIKTIDKELCKFMKVCKDCGELKLMIGFQKYLRMKDGRQNQCIKCKIFKDNHRYKKLCPHCNEYFFTGSKKQLFCSKQCRGEYQSFNSMTKCDFCGKNFPRKPSKLNKNSHNFCSRECLYNFHRTVIKCDYCGQEFSNINSKIKLSEKHFCCVECQRKYQSILEHNPNYNSKKTQEERKNGRSGVGIPQWRKEVYERDNYTCKITGDNKGGNLVAHHLYSYADYPELRTDVNNGVTITEEIHKLFHNTYGYKHNTKEQFDEFVIRYNNGEFKEILDK